MTAPASTAAVMTAASRAPVGGVRRVLLALAMVLAPWGFVITNTCYAWAIRTGATDETGADALALATAEPGVLRTGVIAGMLGCLLIIPAVLGALRVAPRSRLAVVGGSMMIAGYVCYFAVLDSSFVVLAMAERGGPLTDYAAVVDASQAEPFGVVVFATFALGNLVGTALFAVGLLRSGRCPVWAPVLVLTWPPLHVIGLAFVGNEVPQVIGAVLQAVGFAGLAVTMFRRSGRVDETA